jgi:hypothetical protein
MMKTTITHDQRIAKMTFAEVTSESPLLRRFLPGDIAMVYQVLRNNAEHL